MKIWIISTMDPNSDVTHEVWARSFSSLENAHKALIMDANDQLEDMKEGLTEDEMEEVGGVNSLEEALEFYEKWCEIEVLITESVVDFD